MSLRELVKNQRDVILNIAAKHGAQNVRLFGSVARGEETDASDFDFLVDMQEGRSFLDLVEFGDELEELLHRKVDVITDGGISSHLRDRILSESVLL